MSFNIHQLLHLPEVARHFGPLWGHSSFVFEGGNGRLVKLVTGASGVPLQISRGLSCNSSSNLFLHPHWMSDSVTRLFRDMLGYAKLENALHADDVCLLGYPCQIATPQEVKSALVGQYNRLTYKGQILHSTSYKRAARSDSSVVECEDGRYFVITKIISVSKKAFLLYKKAVLAESGDFPVHIKECFVSMVPTMYVVEPCKVMAPCLFMRFENPSASYICTLPNQIERD
ncbi:unnamed protein product [Ixodes persulcatus]